MPAAGSGISATCALIDAHDTRLAWHADAGIALRGLGSDAFKDATPDLGYRRREVADLRCHVRDGTLRRSDERANMATFSVRQKF